MMRLHLDPPSDCLARDVLTLKPGGNTTEITPYGLSLTQVQGPRPAGLRGASSPGPPHSRRKARTLTHAGARPSHCLPALQADDPAIVKAAAAHVQSNVLFCIIDSGVDAGHPDLAGNTISGCSKGSEGCPHAWGLDTSGNSSETGFGHGTHVAGTVMASRNGLGVVGAVGSGATLWFHNAFGNSSGVLESDNVPAWGFCASVLDRLQKINPLFRAVVSMSYGGYGRNASRPTSQAVQAYLTAFYARGDMLFVASAGNEGDGTLSFPAGYDEVISVAATNSSNQATSFSNYNAKVELAAPGKDVVSTLNRQAQVDRIGLASLTATPTPANVSLLNPPPAPLLGSGTGRPGARRGRAGPGGLPGNASCCLCRRGASLPTQSLGPGCCCCAQGGWRERWWTAASATRPAAARPAGCASWRGAAASPFAPRCRRAWPGEVSGRWCLTRPPRRPAAPSPSWATWGWDALPPTTRPCSASPSPRARRCRRCSRQASRSVVGGLHPHLPAALCSLYRAHHHLRPHHPCCSRSEPALCPCPRPRPPPR